MGKSEKSFCKNSRKGKIKIVGKAADKFATSTIYGFVYDGRKIKSDWLK